MIFRVIACATLLGTACSHSEPVATTAPAPVAPAATDHGAAATMSPVARGATLPGAVLGSAPAAAGPLITGSGFTLEALPPAAGAAVGTAATARIIIKPTGVYHLNKDFPTLITVTPPDGVELTKGQLAAADAASFTEKEAAFDLPFTARAAGAKKFSATVKFAVCTDTTCDPKRETLAWEVAVK